jgi:glutamine synthetase
MYTTAATGAKTLPRNLLDAIRAFAESTIFRQTMGAEFVDSYAKLKLQEWDLYTRHLTQWERDTTLDC